MTYGCCSLLGPLKKYERIIQEIIQELGVIGKEDEFVREGKATVYRVHKEINEKDSKEVTELDVSEKIREQLLMMITNKRKNDEPI
ncbi:hypothetical protein SAMN05192559_101458 [Halobacillus karajensis]|uniref:Uncharacterized protein n=1 Tax=Halobacillus karajensis TaxID=195088 RepID=A0A059NYH0_9BACI|nr:hypothetical protein [Halobacillus karajensis]CDQ18905.1 hypothetical protein BN982_01186 [Halobacillus karajensis]CDQ23022.1 hypothetical protein BN983_01241 [Halobacillus karajensis]CDQ26504.1 hypothetical protein BN981_00721 [Halobacillus karajensis]SEH44546.1 hypothetical protein SAMN05192559_101458 [Halobacillus karajensis]